MYFPLTRIDDVPPMPAPSAAVSEEVSHFLEASALHAQREAELLAELNAVRAALSKKEYEYTYVLDEVSIVFMYWMREFYVWIYVSEIWYGMMYYNFTNKHKSMN